MRWLQTERPDPVLPSFDRITGEAFDDPVAVIHLAGDGVAAAIWYDHSEPGYGPVGYGVELQPPTPPPYERRQHLLRELLVELHIPLPHWHLGYLAVGSGQDYEHHASSLLAHQHDRIDPGVGAFAVAGAVDELRLLTRHGYLVGHSVHAAASPYLWSAWRRARSGPPTPPADADTRAEARPTGGESAGIPAPRRAAPDDGGGSGAS